jgi:hypothetical protein
VECCLDKNNFFLKKNNYYFLQKQTNKINKTKKILFIKLQCEMYKITTMTWPKKIRTMLEQKLHAHLMHAEISDFINDMHDIKDRQYFLNMLVIEIVKTCDSRSFQTAMYVTQMQGLEILTKHYGYKSLWTNAFYHDTMYYNKVYEMCMLLASYGLLLIEGEESISNVLRNTGIKMTDKERVTIKNLLMQHIDLSCPTCEKVYVSGSALQKHVAANTCNNNKTIARKILTRSKVITDDNNSSSSSNNNNNNNIIDNKPSFSLFSNSSYNIFTLVTNNNSNSSIDSDTNYDYYFSTPNYPFPEFNVLINDKKNDQSI